MPRFIPAIRTNSPTGEPRHSIRLPPILAIGFAGHCKLENEAKSRAAILSFLQHWKDRNPGIVYGVSSVAAGGDLLFAESCLQLDLAIRVLLPLPKEQFREDFDGDTWQRAQQVLDRALSVDVVGGGQSREESYYECGIETVQQSLLLLALWDGEPSRGLGGTADIVSFAKDQGRPVVWIHSRTGIVLHFNEKEDLLRDPEIDFLNGLPEPEAKPPINTPEDLARAWFLKMDGNATQAAPHFRRLAAIPILCTAAAATFSGAGSFMGGGGTFAGLGIALGIMAAALPAIMHLNRRQILWVRIRTAVEISRSVLAFWHTPAAYDLVGPELVPELSGMLMSLNFLKMASASDQRISLEEFKRCYREERVQSQIVYFAHHAAQADQKAWRYRITIWLSITVAVAANVWMFLNAHWLKYLVPGHRKLAFALTGIICFQLATVAGALLVVNDWQRRRQRYRELHHLLMEWDRQLELSQTWPILLRIASMIERALLAEVIEWRSLIRHRKLPRN